MTEEEEKNKILQKYFEEEQRIFEEAKKKNDRILRAIKNTRNSTFVNDLTKFIFDGDNGINHDPAWRIVRNPIGKIQFEDFGVIKNIWIDEVCYSEDNYGGTICILIKRKRWLVLPYSL